MYILHQFDRWDLLLEIAHGCTVDDHHCGSDQQAGGSMSIPGPFSHRLQTAWRVTKHRRGPVVLQSREGPNTTWLPEQWEYQITKDKKFGYWHTMLLVVSVVLIHLRQCSFSTSLLGWWYYCSHLCGRPSSARCSHWVSSSKQIGRSSRSFCWGVPSMTCLYGLSTRWK